jgi:hypothetical protein
MPVPSGPATPAGNWPDLLPDDPGHTPDRTEERHVAHLIAEQEGSPWSA